MLRQSRLETWRPWNPGGTLKARTMIANFGVVRVIKGHAEKVLSVTYHVPELPMSYTGIAVGDVGVFFLRSSKKQYGFTSVYYPYLVASRICESSGAVPPLRAIVSELQCVFDEEGGTTVRRLAVVDALDRIPTEDSTVALKSASLSPEPAIRWRAIAALLGRNDITGLDAAAAVLTDPSEAAFKDVRHNLAYVIASGVRNPEAIPALRRLLHSREVVARRSAAEALRGMKSEKAIDGLIETLTDSDTHVRYFGVIGLAEITGDDQWAPSIDYFIQNEAAFLTHWREWARARE
jgi:HEAT repeat protein